MTLMTRRRTAVTTSCMLVCICCVVSLYLHRRAVHKTVLCRGNMRYIDAVICGILINYCTNEYISVSELVPTWIPDEPKCPVNEKPYIISNTYERDDGITNINHSIYQGIYCPNERLYPTHRIRACED